MNSNSRDSLCGAKEQFNRVIGSAADLQETNVNYDGVHGIDTHPIDNYANIFYERDDNETDNEFYQIAQHDNATIFIILIPKRSHQSNLAKVFLINTKTINDVKLTRPLVVFVTLVILAH